MKLLRIARGFGEGTALSESVKFINCEEKKTRDCILCTLVLCGHHEGCVWSFYDNVFSFFKLKNTHIHTYIFSVCLHILRRELRVITRTVILLPIMEETIRK